MSARSAATPGIDAPRVKLKSPPMTIPPPELVSQAGPSYGVPGSGCQSYVEPSASETADHGPTSERVPPIEAASTGTLQGFSTGSDQVPANEPVTLPSALSYWHSDIRPSPVASHCDGVPNASTIGPVQPPSVRHLVPGPMVLPSTRLSSPNVFQRCVMVPVAASRTTVREYPSPLSAVSSTSNLKVPLATTTPPVAARPVIQLSQLRSPLGRSP